MIDVPSDKQQVTSMKPSPFSQPANHDTIFSNHIKDRKSISIVLNSKRKLSDQDEEDAKKIQVKLKRHITITNIFSDNDFKSKSQKVIESHQSFLQTLRNMQRKNYEPSNIKVMLKTDYPVIHNLIHKYFNFKIYNKEDQYQDIFLIWIDTYVSQEFVKRLKSHQRINHFPNSCQLGRKDLLALNLNAAKIVMPQLYQFYPKTWVLPKQYEAFSQRDHSSSFFIVKPHANCQGRGIYLSRQPCITSKDQVIVQEYVQNPMVIDGCKFDLRVYVLVRSLDPLRIYVYQEGLCRLATSKYSKPSENNFRNEKMHLTNYAINKFSPNFVGNIDIKNDNKGHKRSLTSAMKTVSDMGFDTKKILQRVDSIIIRSILAGYTKMLQSYKKARESNINFKNIKQFMNSKEQHKFFNHDNTNQQSVCFELLGFDIMLLETGEPILLEINHQPSLVTDSPLDLSIKRCLIMDTINILSLDQNDKITQENLKDSSFSKNRHIQERQMQNKGGYRRILPLSHTKLQQKSQEQMTHVQKHIDLYDSMINKIMLHEFKRQSKLKMINYKTITSRNNRSHISKQSQEDNNRSNISAPKTSDSKNSKHSNQKPVALTFYNLFSDTKHLNTRNGFRKMPSKEKQTEAQLQETIVKNHILLQSIERSSKLSKQGGTISKRQGDGIIDLKPQSTRQQFYSKKQDSKISKIPEFFVEKETCDFPDPSMQEVDKIAKAMRLNLLTIKNKGVIHYISSNKSKKGLEQRARAQTSFIPTFSSLLNRTSNPISMKEKGQNKADNNSRSEDKDRLEESYKERDEMMGQSSDRSRKYKEIYENSIRQKIEKINNLKIIKNNLHKLNFINFVQRTKGIRQVIGSAQAEIEQMTLPARQ